MKSHIIYGYHAVRAALNRYPQAISEVVLQHKRDDERVEGVMRLAQEQGVVVSRQPAVFFRDLMPEAIHQGVMAYCHHEISYSEADLPALLEEKTQPLLLILDGVTDPHNLGACLRSANAFGVDAVIAPKDRAVGLTPVVRKVACGAAESTPFVTVTNLVRTMKHLQQQGVWFVGTCAKSDASLVDIDLTSGIGWVLGSEGKGVRQLTQKHCDFMARIDLLGDVSSLNVSVAAGICLYETQRQRARGR